MKHETLNKIMMRNSGAMKFPLWKLRIHDAEYQALKEELRLAYDENCLDYYCKEAALYYAEWWRREYSGGFPSKERVASSAGVYDSELFFQLAKNAMHEWKCKVYGVNRHEYFYSLLLQGGLPMKQIQSSWGNYTNFLEHAMTELISMGITNWEDTSIFDELDCVKFLPQSFRNECIYSISMQVIRSIVEDKADILPYDIKEERFRKLNNDLYNAYERRRRSNPLAFSWNLKLDEGKVRLYYKLNNQNEIRSDVLIISPNVYRFEIHVAGKFLARYARTEHKEDSSIYTCVNKDYLVQEWKGEKFIPVKIILDSGEDILITVNNCYAPDFSVPQKFIKSGDSFVQHGAANEDNIIIFNDDWSAIDNNEVTDIELNKGKYYLASFNDSIRLQSNENGEIATFDNKFSSYHTEYHYRVAPWCLNSTENFLASVPSIVVFNDNGEAVSHDVVKLFRSRHGNGEWHSLHELEGSIPGSIQIKVKFPDRKEEIRSFYYISDLSYTTQNETLYDADIQWSCSYPVHIGHLGIEGIEITDNGNGSFHLHRNDDSKKFPSVCQFVIIAATSAPTKLVISSPFKGLAVLDAEGKEIENNDMICAQNLYSYNLFAHSIGTITIKMAYISEDIENAKSLTIQRSSNGLMLLSDINDLLERLFMLYEKRAFNRSSYIKISIKSRFGNYKKEFRVRRYSLDTKSIGNGECIVMDIDDEPDDDFYTSPKDYSGQLMACTVGCDPDKMKVYPMHTTDNCTKFRFHVIEGIHQFIVFSNKNDAARVIPRYYNLEKLDMTISQRINIRKERLAATEERLVKDSLESDSWVEVFNSYKIVAENNLIFSTFDCFIIIAHNPDMIAKFVLGLCYHGYSDNSISDFNRYAGEFAFSLHWVRTDCWMNALNEISNLDELSQQYLVNDMFKFMTEVLKTELYQKKAIEFASYIMTGNIKPERVFSFTDLRDYKESIHGVTDTGQDLPTMKISLNEYIFPPFSQDALPWQKVALLSPLKIAELITSKEADKEFWTDENDSLRRVINFYRIYATKTYSNILMKAIAIYSNK
jgi:hypothetical protein